jgi:hypothetical protein
MARHRPRPSSAISLNSSFHHLHSVPFRQQRRLSGLLRLGTSCVRRAPTTWGISHNAELFLPQSSKFLTQIGFSRRLCSNDRPRYPLCVQCLCSMRCRCRTKLPFAVRRASDMRCRRGRRSRRTDSVDLQQTNHPSAAPAAPASCVCYPLRFCVCASAIIAISAAVRLPSPSPPVLRLALRSIASAFAMLSIAVASLPSALPLLSPRVPNCACSRCV